MVPTCAAVASPPRKPYRSSSTTCAPARPAATAAATPAAPPPTTSTSQEMVAARIWGTALITFPDLELRQHPLRPGASGGNGGGHSRRASADDQHIAGNGGCTHLGNRPDYFS